MSRFTKFGAALLQAQVLREAPSRRPARSRAKDPELPGTILDHGPAAPAPPEPPPSPSPPLPTMPVPDRTGPSPTLGAEPMILTLDQFLTFVLEWAQQSVQNIRRVWPLPGGWEAWAQAEIAAYINEIDASTSIQREARVYPGQKRADFLLNVGTTLQLPQQVVVEMKCESLNNRAAFIPGINKDVTKLQNELEVPYNTCQKLTLGIFFSREAGDQLQRLGYTVIFTENEIGVAARQC